MSRFNELAGLTESHTKSAFDELAGLTEAKQSDERKLAYEVVSNGYLLIGYLKAHLRGATAPSTGYRMDTKAKKGLDKQTKALERTVEKVVKRYLK